MSRFQITIIILFMLAIFSCDKNEADFRTEIYGKWKATEFISIESFAYPKKDGYNPVIEFKSDGSYRLKLDMNDCMGNFTLPDKANILMTDSGCTKICCDSEFSRKFVQMLPQVKSYQLENNILKLEVPGWGWINLELND